jgi:hypothetical protein
MSKSKILKKYAKKHGLKYKDLKTPKSWKATDITGMPIAQAIAEWDKLCKEMPVVGFFDGPPEAPAKAQKLAYDMITGNMNDYNMHEALDRTHCISIMLDQLILDHPSIQDDPEFQKLANEASEAIEALYQAIGRKHL